MKEEETILYIKETMENIAHQWRQPLSQINSTVSVIDKILYEENIQNPLLEEKLKEIEALTKYMSNTIDDFKSHFVHNVEKKNVKLTTIVKDAILKVEANLKENSIALSSKIDLDCECECYADQLQQIVIVLLNNAKDALLDRNTFEAKIQVEIVCENDEFVIKISDNAGGITKSVMQKIFEPYYTTKHKSQGTGIGLFMARKIVEEQHFGSLNVKNVENGSEFSISLPKGKNSAC